MITRKWVRWDGCGESADQFSDLKKATVGSTVPLRLFDFSQPKLENVDAGQCHCL